MAEKVNEFLGTGRRKCAIARVRLASGAGKIIVNGRALENYFVSEAHRNNAILPLTMTENAAKYDLQINVIGGGPSGQAGAVRHGIARALIAADATLRAVLKAGGMLTRDARV